MRVKRTEMEDRRIGIPDLRDRVEAIEELLKAAATAVVGPERDLFDSIQTRMDQLDIQYPDEG